MKWSVHYWPAVIWLATLTFASLTRAPILPDFDLLSLDKVIHFGIYGFLVLLLMGGLRFAGVSLSTRKILGLVVFAASWGILMEVIQGLLPYRTFEYDDMIANTIGACLVPLGNWLYRLFGYRGI